MMSYEFNETHNEKFKQLEYVLLGFVLLLVLGGILRIIDTLLEMQTLDSGLVITLFIVSLIEIGIAGLLYRPIDNIRNIYETEGSDIEELMVVFKELNQNFAIIIILTFILVVGYIIVLLAEGSLV